METYNILQLMFGSLNSHPHVRVCPNTCTPLATNVIVYALQVSQ